MRKRIAIFVAVIQCVLFAAHWFVYATWSAFWMQADPPGIPRTAWAVAILSVSFVGATLLAWRYANQLVRAIYSLAALWLGLLSFLFFAAWACWAVEVVARVLRWRFDGRLVVAVLFGAAIVAGICGVVNAAWLRVTRVRANLPNLPEAWRGRVAALVSDTHLGHVRGLGFVRRIVAQLNRLKPDIVFLAGDLYDGTAVNAKALAQPLGEIAAPQGTYFVTGNHEEFTDPGKYIEAMAWRRRARAEERENTRGWVADRGNLLSRFHLGAAAARSSASGGNRSHARQHPNLTRTAPPRSGGSGRNFASGFGAHARRPIRALDAFREAPVRAIRAWLAALRQNDGLHLVRRGHLGTADAAGNGSGNCVD